MEPLGNGATVRTQLRHSFSPCPYLPLPVLIFPFLNTGATLPFLSGWQLHSQVFPPRNRGRFPLHPKETEDTGLLHRLASPFTFSLVFSRVDKHHVQPSSAGYNFTKLKKRVRERVRREKKSANNFFFSSTLTFAHAWQVWLPGLNMWRHSLCYINDDEWQQTPNVQTRTNYHKTWSILFHPYLLSLFSISLVSRSFSIISAKLVSISLTSKYCWSWGYCRHRCFALLLAHPPSKITAKQRASNLFI